VKKKFELGLEKYTVMNFIRENAKRETRKLFSRSRFKKAEGKSRFIFQVSRFKNAKTDFAFRVNL